MKYIVSILVIALGFTTYLLIKQHYELYGYRNGRGIGNCLLAKEKAGEYIKNYQTHYSIDPNKTQAIWFSEDVVRCLYINLIREDKKDTVDGFRVYLATYIQGETPPTARAENPIANTVIFVPTSPYDSGRIHKNLWNLITRDKEKSRGILKADFFDVPNHGELCPQKCE